MKRKQFTDIRCILVKVTVTFTTGNADYDINQTECTVRQAISEISRKALTGLIDIITLTGKKTITFTFFTTEKGGIYPFFYGSIK